MRRLQKDWVIERGQTLVKNGMLMGWREVVEKRGDDLYKFNIALDVIEALKNGKTFEDAYKIIEQTCLCNESEDFVLLAIKIFANNGLDFVLWAENERLFPAEPETQAE